MFDQNFKSDELETHVHVYSASSMCSFWYVYSIADEHDKTSQNVYFYQLKYSKIRIKKYFTDFQLQISYVNKIVLSDSVMTW